MACRELKKRIPYPLTVLEEQEALHDTKRLEYISDHRITMETPDSAGGTAEMQPNAGICVLAARSNFEFSRQSMGGLL
jgi:hypothetical protein